MPGHNHKSKVQTERDTRAKALSFLKDRTSLAKTLAKTTMCKWIEKGENCPHGDKCTFAHSEQELKQRRCKFEDCCEHVVLEDGVYSNVPNKKVCKAYHPNETKENYTDRTTVKQSWATVAKETKLAPVVEKQVEPYLIVVSKKNAIEAVARAVEEGEREILVSIVGNWCDEV